jgi:hypothetical protein
MPQQGYKAEIEDKRITYAISQFKKIGIEIEVRGVTIFFIWKNERIQFFPFTGWHSGKSIIDGRGIQKLLNQLK